MKTQITEAEMREMVEGLKVRNSDTTSEHIIRMARLNLECEGFGWSQDLERKVKYCININPN
ncbi:MAG TPA: hypothetical protein VMF08_19760 [Candidatus Sulfotelmatobacter sp.]|nr:hypothetical protein [Candidatus Sulfotelmatobacter sp.]